MYKPLFRYFTKEVTKEEISYLLFLLHLDLRLKSVYMYFLRFKEPYHSFFLFDIRRDEIMQKEESFGVDGNEYMILKLRYEAALD